MSSEGQLIPVIVMAEITVSDDRLMNSVARYSRRATFTTIIHPFNENKQVGFDPVRF